MTEETAATDEAAEQAPKPSMVKKIGKLAGIVMLCLAALFGGLVAAMGPDGAMALLTGGGGEDHAMAVDAHTEDGEGHGDMADVGAKNMPANPDGHIVVSPFKEIIVNVTATTATGRQTSRFLKLNLAIVFDETLPGANHIEDRKLFLRDSYQDYLRQLSENDLQGSIGLVNLKAELLSRARAITGSDAPQEILIADLIIQ